MKNKENISILHLSDFRFSRDMQADMDVKVPLQLNAHNKIDQFKDSISNLPSKPDYVVVSGDITTAGQAEGFEIFNQVMVGLIKDGKLPPVKKFIVVPGNHDVKESTSPQDPQRWDNFLKSIGHKCLVPWIVEVNSSYAALTSLINKDLSDNKTIYGGTTQDALTGESTNIPFLFDTEKKVLFYAFNSALLSHTKTTGEKAFELTPQYRDGDIVPRGTDKKFEQDMWIDQAIIAEEEIGLFAYCMDKIKCHWPHNYENCLKIAVLHHHIAPISYCNGTKKSEPLMNADSLKNTLVNYGFNVVLHGHKYWNEVYWDTTISGGGALFAISGGTICGTPSTGDKPGFYSLDFTPAEKKVKVHYHKMRDLYGGNNERGEDKVFSYDTANRNMDLVQRFNLTDLLSRVEGALLDNFICQEYLGDMQYGWSRIITSKDRVGTVSTAFGLIIAEMLKITNVERYQERRSDIIDTLWKARSNEGGFSATSQVVDAEIEPTVWALRAFYYVRDMEKFEKTLQALYNMIPKSPLNEKSSITTLTLVMDVLCECDPGNKLLEQINSIILKKAHCDKEHRLYWTKSTKENEEASPVHTMLAVISLLNYAKVRGVLEQTKKYLYNCGEWILDANWGNVEEIIRRPFTRTTDNRLTYQHYTAPWGIIALLRLGYSKKESKIVNEMRKILKSEENGLWSWNFDKNYPIWAIYNAISAINEFALCDVEF